MKKIEIMGCGYIGLPTAVTFALAGYEVCGFDINEQVVAQLNAGHIHIVEPDLQDALTEALASGRLHFTTVPETADVFIICVQTPHRDTPEGKRVSDMRFVESAARSVGGVLREGNLCVLESTSPPGSTRLVETIKGNKKKGTRMHQVDPELSRDMKKRSDYMPKRPARKNSVTGTNLRPKVTASAPVQQETSAAPAPVRERVVAHSEMIDRNRSDGSRVSKPAVSRGPKTSKGVKFLLIMLVTLLGISLLVLGFNQISALAAAGRMVEVPDLVGKTLTDAKAICTDNSLVLDTSNVEYTLTESTEKGQIISCNPAVGTEVEKGSRISVSVSSGIGVKISDYRGQNINAVIKELSQYNFLKVTTKEEENETAEPGSILRQELLEPGTMFNPNNVSEIVLVYASYPTVVIPYEINGMAVEEASKMLEALGVEVFSSTLDTTGLSEEEIANLNTGVVIRSDPEAGSEYTQREDNYVVLYYY